MNRIVRTEHPLFVGGAVIVLTLLVSGAVALAAGFGQPLGAFAEGEATTTPTEVTTETPATTLPDPSCTLEAEKLELEPDEDLVLTYTTSDASVFSMNHDLGRFEPVEGGTITIHPPVATTGPVYMGTASRDGIGQNCFIPRVVVREKPAPSCTLTDERFTDAQGRLMTKLSWTTAYADLFSINHDTGMLSPVGAGSITIPTTATTTYIGTAGRDGIGASCDATMVQTPPANPPSDPAPACRLNALRKVDIDYDNDGVISGETAPAGTIGDAAFLLKVAVGTASCPAGKVCDVNGENDISAADASVVLQFAAESAQRPWVLVWNTDASDHFSIDQGIGATARVGAGAMSVDPKVTTTYTGTATGNGEAHCPVTIVIEDTPETPAPTCSLSVGSAGDVLDYTADGKLDMADAQYLLEVAVGTASCPAGKVCDIDGSGTVLARDSYLYAANMNNMSLTGTHTLVWSTINGKTFSLDKNIGTVIPFPAGRTLVSPTVTTTYTGTVENEAGVGHCSATVTIGGGGGEEPEAPSCTLIATPKDEIDTSALDYTSDGKLTDADAQYLLEVAVGTKTCPAGKVCDVTGDGSVLASDAKMVLEYVRSLPTKGTHTLQWTTKNATSFSLDNGVDATLTTALGTAGVSPKKTTTYTGTATGPRGTAQCTVTIKKGGSGGGSGSAPNPSVFLGSVAGEVAGAYIYLADAPYTGLDLGVTGTVVYWSALVIWSLALAYLVLFGAVPSVRRQAFAFGARVSHTLNTKHETPIVPVVPAPIVYSAPEPAATPSEVHEAGPAYSSFDGFKSFARNEALSIEDIVKGLTRAQKIPAPVAAPVAAAAAPVAAHTEPIYEHVEPIEAPRASAPVAEVAVPTDIRGFAHALLMGDREGVFAGLRQYVRGGGKPEQLLSQVAFLLDDAYRARVEGTACDPDVARQAARLSTPQLEQLVTSLTTAIDSSYSVDVTGAKLALTRALAVLGA